MSSIAMGYSITWNDVVIACDDLIETIKGKMDKEPEHGEFWQKRLAVAMLKRQIAVAQAALQKLEE